MNNSLEDLVAEDNVKNWKEFIKSFFKVSFVIFYLLLCPIHVFCLGITVVFDTICLVREDRSITNCTAKVIIPSPQPLVILCFITTIINTAVIMVALYIKPFGIQFCGFQTALKLLLRTGSFWSLNILFIVVIVDYVILTCHNISGINITVAITLVLFFTSRLITTYSINYVQPIMYPRATERSFRNVSAWLAYWLTLIMFFLDSVHAMLALSLDVVEKVTPYGNIKPGSHDFITVINLLLLGVKVTFEARLFTFYWNKIFHGNKDLFSTTAILKRIDEEEDNV